jgi:hypothetical protein
VGGGRVAEKCGKMREEHVPEAADPVAVLERQGQRQVELQRLSFIIFHKYIFQLIHYPHEKEHNLFLFLSPEGIPFQLLEQS